MPKESTKRGKAGKVEKRKGKKGKLMMACTQSQWHAPRVRLQRTFTNYLELDPNAPKRGLSAYMFFANEQRENVRAENKDISFGKPPSNRTPCVLS
jgi:hypothetical protein